MTLEEDHLQGALRPFPTRVIPCGADPPQGQGTIPSDEDLLVAAGGGFMEAFGELVHRHHATAYRTAYRFLADSEEARDIAQEAFLNLLRSCGSYSPRAPFRTYLYRIVSNLCIDHRRKLRPVGLAELPDHPSDAPGPPGELAACERESAVRKALSALPERQRMAVILKYYEGLGYREMAQALGTTEKSVERLLDRGRAALLRDLGPLLQP
jgi:RNA polymerase sigma-70 factor (ECF subfamily)